VHDLEILICDADNTIARSRQVFYQVRTGTMSHDRLERIEQALRLSRAQHGMVSGALIVLEDSAEVPSADVRAAQRKLVEDMTGDPKMRIAIVIPGTGVRSMLVRTIARTVFGKSKTVRFFATTEEGAAWLAPDDSALSADIAHAGERIRRTARNAHEAK
jgi:hypothetical protein